MDNFDEFFRKREVALLDRIEKAMGKTITREESLSEPEPEVKDFQIDDEG